MDLNAPVVLARLASGKPMVFLQHGCWARWHADERVLHVVAAGGEGLEWDLRLIDERLVDVRGPLGCPFVGVAGIGPLLLALSSTTASGRLQRPGVDSPALPDPTRAALPHHD